VIPVRPDNKVELYSDRSGRAAEQLGHDRAAVRPTCSYALAGEGQFDEGERWKPVTARDAAASGMVSR
jgi:hypothetical protein